MNNNECSSSNEIFFLLFTILFWIINAVVFVAGFFYWIEFLGPFGFLVALTYFADYILLIIRIANIGFSDWYVILVIIQIILMWCMGMLKKSRTL